MLGYIILGEIRHQLCEQQQRARSNAIDSRPNGQLAQDTRERDRRHANRSGAQLVTLQAQVLARQGRHHDSSSNL